MLVILFWIQISVSKSKWLYYYLLWNILLISIKKEPKPFEPVIHYFFHLNSLISDAYDWSQFWLSTYNISGYIYLFTATTLCKVILMLLILFWVEMWVVKSKRLKYFLLWNKLLISIKKKEPKRFEPVTLYFFYFVTNL